MTLNSHKKALISMGIAFLVTISWFVGSLIYMIATKDTMQHFVLRLVINCLFQLLPTTIFMIIMVRFSFRYRAAEKKGLILCSRCEYPLAANTEIQICPECGCTRTITAHKKAWRGWEAWLK